MNIPAPSWGDLAEMIVALGTIANVILSRWNAAKINQVHESTNGKMEMLLAEVRRAEFARGQKAEKDSYTNNNNSEKPPPP